MTSTASPPYQPTSNWSMTRSQLRYCRSASVCGRPSMSWNSTWSGKRAWIRSTAPGYDACLWPRVPSALNDLQPFMLSDVLARLHVRIGGRHRGETRLARPGRNATGRDSPPRRAPRTHHLFNAAPAMLVEFAGVALPAKALGLVASCHFPPLHGRKLLPGVATVVGGEQPGRTRIER